MLSSDTAPPWPCRNAAMTTMRGRGIRAALFSFLVVILLLAGCGGRGLPDAGAIGGALQLLQAITQESQRDDEAAQFIQSYVPAEFRVPVTINVAAPTTEEFKRIFTSRGNDVQSLGKHTWGFFLTARPDLDQQPTVFLMRDASAPDLREILFRALHEWGHVVWHYKLTDREWNQWRTTWNLADSDLSAEEGWANTLADALMGKKRGDEPGRLFEQIRASVKARGGAMQRY